MINVHLCQAFEPQNLRTLQVVFHYKQFLRECFANVNKMFLECFLNVSRIIQTVWNVLTNVNKTLQRPTCFNDQDRFKNTLPDQFSTIASFLCALLLATWLLTCSIIKRELTIIMVDKNHLYPSGPHKCIAGSRLVFPSRQVLFLLGACCEIRLLPSRSVRQLTNTVCSNPMFPIELHVSGQCHTGPQRNK